MRFRTIEKKSLRLLQAYDWPGNIRELQNVIERAVILCEGETFSVDETWLRRELPVARSRVSTRNRVFVRQEKEMIETALEECYGQVSGPSGAATKLGLPARTLDSKIKRFKSTNIGSKCLAPAESVPALCCETSCEDRSRCNETGLRALG
jgi:formate hydrogenlyase transcriptional activator